MQRYCYKVIGKKQNQSYYEEIFEYYFDILNADGFQMSNSQGSAVEAINRKLLLNNQKLLEDYDPKEGFEIYGGYLNLDNFTENTDYTFFVSFKHDGKFTNSTGYEIGLLDDTYIKPTLRIYKNKFSMEKTDSTKITETILSAYRDEHKMIWFCKLINLIKVGLCDGISDILTTDNFSQNPYSTKMLSIDVHYKMQRICVTKNLYDLNSKEFHKILFLEKSKGTYFE